MFELAFFVGNVFLFCDGFESLHDVVGGERVVWEDDAGFSYFFVVTVLCVDPGEDDWVWAFVDDGFDGALCASVAPSADTFYFINEDEFAFGEEALLADDVVQEVFDGAFLVGEGVDCGCFPGSVRTVQIDAFVGAVRVECESFELSEALVLSDDVVCFLRAVF